MKEYDLTLIEVFEKLLTTGGWFVGEGFSRGVFLCYDKNLSCVRLKQIYDDKLCETDLGNPSFSKIMNRQKYKECLTYNEILSK